MYLIFYICYYSTRVSYSFLYQYSLLFPALRPLYILPHLIPKDHTPKIVKIYLTRKIFFPQRLPVVKTSSESPHSPCSQAICWALMIRCTIWYLHGTQEKHHLCPKTLGSLFQPGDSRTVKLNASYLSLERRNSFLLLALYSGQFLRDKASQLTCRDNKTLLLDNQNVF